jgi:hypothetical protein
MLAEKLLSLSGCNSDLYSPSSGNWLISSTGPLFHARGLTDRTHGKRHALISHKIELIHHWLCVPRGINHKAAPQRIKAPPLSLKAYSKMEVQPRFIALNMTLITHQMAFANGQGL